VSLGSMSISVSSLTIELQSILFNLELFGEKRPDEDWSKLNNSSFKRFSSS
jgi:hypothetical protein